MSTALRPPTEATRAPRGVPRAVTVAAWAVPVLVIAQFAWLATVPVVVVLVGALWDRRLQVLRGPAVALTATYALPYIIWKTRTDPAPSLSRDIHPALAVLVVAAAVVVLVTDLYRRRRSTGA